MVVVDVHKQKWVLGLLREDEARLSRVWPTLLLLPEGLERVLFICMKTTSGQNFSLSGIYMPVFLVFFVCLLFSFSTLFFLSSKVKVRWKVWQLKPSRTPCFTCSWRTSKLGKTRQQAMHLKPLSRVTSHSGVLALGYSSAAGGTGGLSASFPFSCSSIVCLDALQVGGSLVVQEGVTAPWRSEKVFFSFFVFLVGGSRLSCSSLRTATPLFVLTFI